NLPTSNTPQPYLQSRALRTFAETFAQQR
ncbi:hypothetical protein TSMEX_004449, partial [Taenia solium]